MTQGVKGLIGLKLEKGITELLGMLMKDDQKVEAE
jgi:hypothetical protein